MSCSDPRIAELLGSFALGACPEPERAAVARHLESCADCRAALQALRPVTAALLEEPEAPPPGPELKAAVMRRVREEASLFAAAGGRDAPPAAPAAAAPPRRRLAALAARPRALAAVAAALIVLVVAGVALRGGVHGGERVVAVQVATRVAPSGQGRIVVRDGRGRIEVSGLPGAGRGREYQVWVAHGTRAPEPTSALFTVDGRGRATVDLPGRVDDYDAVLVTDEPRGGSRTPTGQVVLQAKV